MDRIGSTDQPLIRRPLQRIPVRLVNAVGSSCARLGIEATRLDADGLCGKAEQRTGLRDFGDETFRQALAVLLDSIEREAHLHTVGRHLHHKLIVGKLSARLQMQAYWTAHPHVLDAEIARPLFILGLPRTGTTLLFYLLAQDPAHRDAGVRYGKGSWPGAHATLIHRDEIFPVCSPRLLDEQGLLDAESLLKFPLLCETDGSAVDDRADWHSWLRRAIKSDISWEHTSCVLCGQASVVLQAATEGLGIALARGLLVADDLAAGRLVQCAGPSLPSDFAYYFVRPADKPPQPKVDALKDWLLAAIGKTPHLNPRPLAPAAPEDEHEGAQSRLNGTPPTARDMMMNRGLACG